MTLGPAASTCSLMLSRAASCFRVRPPSCWPRAACEPSPEPLLGRVRIVDCDAGRINCASASTSTSPPSSRQLWSSLLACRSPPASEPVPAFAEGLVARVRVVRLVRAESGRLLLWREGRGRRQQHAGARQGGSSTGAAATTRGRTRAREGAGGRGRPRARRHALVLQKLEQFRGEPPAVGPGARRAQFDHAAPVRTECWEDRPILDTTVQFVHNQVYLISTIRRGGVFPDRDFMTAGGAR